MFDDDSIGSDGGKAAAQAYWNALSKLRAVWLDTFNEHLPTVGNNAKGAFEQALERVRIRFASDPAGGARLRDALDVESEFEIADALLRSADVDDLPPNVVKGVIRDQCHKLGDGRHELRSLLRPVLDALFENPAMRRPRFGANRHWPRLRQYLRELETESDWSPSGRGIRLVNAGGRGPVAAEPMNPWNLAVVVQTNYL